MWCNKHNKIVRFILLQFDIIFPYGNLHLRQKCVHEAENVMQAEQETEANDILTISCYCALLINEMCLSFQLTKIHKDVHDVKTIHPPHDHNYCVEVL